MSDMENRSGHGERDHHGEGHVHAGHVHHCHTHSPESTRNVLNRLSRIIGHLQAVQRMVDDERDCSEILVQLAAVRSALDNASKVILQEHLRHCIVDAVREGDQQAIEDLCEAVNQYLK